ncbi:hypothetical protein I7I48_11416 [Histoplasma ohiense]|nr:hypothetical protein I7I48_11416 [Histoplasma ohiense (nom. inval.)]
MATWPAKSFSFGILSALGKVEPYFGRVLFLDLLARFRTRTGPSSVVGYRCNCVKRERERIPELLESQRIWETLNQLSKATYHIYGWKTSPQARIRSTLSQGPDKTERSRSQPPHLSTPQEKKKKKERKKKEKRKEGKKETQPFGMRPRRRRLH